MDLERLADFTPLMRVRQRQQVTLTRNLEQLETDCPFVVFAGLFDRTLGGFIHHNLFAASVCLAFSNAKLHVCFTDDRPYLADIIAMNPYIERCWTEDGLDNPLLGYFDSTSTRLQHAQQETWEALGATEPDLLLTPWMMHPRKLGGFATRARLRIPSSRQEGLDARLQEVGLSPGQWFCTMHYREPGYLDRPDDRSRDLDYRDAFEIARHVTRDLGGQVVRLGHPGMKPLPPLDGMIDLSDRANEFMLQANAVARARSHLQLSDSGPMALAQAMGTPMALGNAVTVGFFDENSLILPRHIVDRAGKKIPLELIRRKGLLDRKLVETVLSLRGFKYRGNSRAELLALADDMHAKTIACDGWRFTPVQSIENFPETLNWPRPEMDRGNYVEYPDAK